MSRALRVSVVYTILDTTESGGKCSKVQNDFNHLQMSFGQKNPTWVTEHLNLKFRKHPVIDPKKRWLHFISKVIGASALLKMFYWKCFIVRMKCNSIVTSQFSYAIFVQNIRIANSTTQSSRNGFWCIWYQNVRIE